MELRIGCMIVSHKLEIFISLIVFILLGCSPSGGERMYHFTRFSMDCAIEYTIVAEERSIARSAVQQAHKEIDRIESLLWEGNSSSTIFQFNHSYSGVVADRETFEFITRAKSYVRMTAGAFDISIQPILELYDFTRKEAVPPTEEALRERVALRDLANLELDATADHRYRMRKKN